MDAKKKLAIIVANYFEQCSGGAELQAYYLAKTAKERGWEVYHIFISNGQPYQNSLNIHLLPIKKSTVASKAGNVKFIYAIHVWKYLKRIKPDAVYQRSASALTGICALYAKYYKINTTYHIASDNDLTDIKTYSLFKLIETLLTSYGQKHSRTIIAQTHTQSEMYLSKHSANVTEIIPNGHPVPSIPYHKSHIVSIVWVANMKRQKQPEIFINLAKELKKSLNVTCTMIGRIDEYGTVVKSAVEDGIIIALGELSNSEVNRVLEKSHILVNTSKYEGFSNTFIQAWMRENPVVSLNVDPDNIITTYELGYLSQTFTQLVTDTKKLICDHKLREYMAMKAKKYAIINYSIDNLNMLLTAIS